MEYTLLTHPICSSPASRNIHYPPETASVMLMARMVAAVKQVGRLSASCIFSCFSSKELINSGVPPVTTTRTGSLSCPK